MRSKLSQLVNAGLCTTTQSKNEDLVHTQELRQQLADQMRCLSERTDAQSAMIGDLREFYRRRGELEADHGRALDKLARTLAARGTTGVGKHRCDDYQFDSMRQVWDELLENTKTEARQRTSLSDMYNNHVVVKLGHHAENLQRVAKKCRDIGTASHDEISRVLNELHTTLRTYQLCYAQSCEVEAKFRVSEEQRNKYEASHPSKVGASRKHRMLLKEYEKRQAKYDEFERKALSARNEYILAVGAANAALRRYFDEDLSALIDCMDLGVTHWLRSLLSTVVSGRKALCRAEMASLAELAGLRDSADARIDRRQFVEAQSTAVFAHAKPFFFRPHMNDMISQFTSHKTVQKELIKRYTLIEKRLFNLKKESIEVANTQATTEATVSQLQTEPVPDVDRLFDDDADRSATCRQTDANMQQRKQELVQAEDFYLETFKQHLLNGNLVRRLEARSDLIRQSLGGALPGRHAKDVNFNDANTAGSPASNSSGNDDVDSATRGNSVDNSCECEMEPKNDYPAASETAGISGDSAQSVKRRSTKQHNDVDVTRPKLFNGNLQDYVKATGEEIPLVVLSCIRMLNQFALHCQGVFRVSGSQLDINTLKEGFEKGGDPLADVDDINLVNPVAGVLKLYFRELREPLIPICVFDRVTRAAQISNKHAFVIDAKNLIASLPPTVILVMRYLFAFLNHLSEFSDENMMDPYNLAICLGPTLIPIPEGQDQVFYQNHVTEFTKNLIVYHEEIFSWDLPGPVYEKYCTIERSDLADGGCGARDCETASKQNGHMTLFDSPPNVDNDEADVSSFVNSPSTTKHTSTTLMANSSNFSSTSVTNVNRNSVASLNGGAPTRLSWLGEDYACETVIRRQPYSQSPCLSAGTTNPTDVAGASSRTTQPPSVIDGTGRTTQPSASKRPDRTSQVVTPKQLLPDDTTAQLRRRGSSGDRHTTTRHRRRSPAQSAVSSNRLSLQMAPSTYNAYRPYVKTVPSAVSDAGVLPTPSPHTTRTEQPRLRRTLTLPPAEEEGWVVPCNSNDPIVTANAATAQECYKPDLVRNLPASSAKKKASKSWRRSAT